MQTKRNYHTKEASKCHIRFLWFLYDRLTGRCTCFVRHFRRRRSLRRTRSERRRESSFGQITARFVMDRVSVRTFWRITFDRKIYVSRREKDGVP